MRMRTEDAPKCLRKRGRTEESAFSDLDCLAETSHGQVHQATIFLLLCIQEFHQQRCQCAIS